MASSAWKERPGGRRRSWSVVWVRPDGRRARTAAASELEAIALVAAAKLALTRGQDWQPPKAEPGRGPGGEPSQPPQAPVLGAMAVAFIEDKSRGTRPATVRAYAQSLDLLLQCLSEATGLPMRAIQGQHVNKDAMRGFYEWLATVGTGRLKSKQPRQLSTVRKHIDRVYVFLAWASKEDAYRDFIREPGRFQMARVVKVRPPAPSWAQMAACVGACRAEYMRRATTLMYYTGLRIDLQVMHLRWSDVDLDRGVISIKRLELCKTPHEYELQREIPLHPDLAVRMGSWRAASTPDGFVVALPSPAKKRRSLRGRDTRRAWVRALGEWPADWKSPNHCFRHGFVSGLYRAGVSAHVVGYLAGHKSPHLSVSAYTDQRAAFQEDAVLAVRSIPRVAPRLLVMGESMRLENQIGPGLPLTGDRGEK